MVVTEISIIHHVGIVLILIWLLSFCGRSHPIFYLLSLVYLWMVHERFTMRLRRKLKLEGRKAANQRRILVDPETVRWLNHTVEKMWPVCMEKIVSQRVFLPIIPWFLQKYKPWTVKKISVQHLCLGKTPPLFTEIRVLREPRDDDHMVLELGLNFLTAADMSAILVAKLRKRLGFGMATKMHLTGLHVEGKVLVGVKFISHYPFIGRVRVSFAEPPYFQMTVKPLFSHGLNVTEVPGIAGWLDKLLAIAFEETLVEPNMLVVNLEKLLSAEPEDWFSVNGREPVAYALVEVIEAADLISADLNGFSDPYVTGRIGQYRFATPVQSKTLTPRWLEEFKIPIVSWDAQCLLEVGVHDKDNFSSDDNLGTCTVNVSDFRDGQKHDMWLPLKEVKTGRLHLAVTVIELNAKERRAEEVKIDQSKTAQPGPISKPQIIPQKNSDTFEEINVEGQKDTGIRVHHPGSEVSQTWEHRKGKNKLTIDTEILSSAIPKLSKQRSDSSSSDEGHRDKGGKIYRGIKKIIHKSFNRKHRKNEDSSSSLGSPLLQNEIEGGPVIESGSSDHENSALASVVLDANAERESKHSDMPVV